MRLCLTCYHVWPNEAQVCGSCGRSFGGRACRRRGHLNPKDAQFCVRCGTQELTEATNYVPLGWLSRGLAWLCVIAAIVWLSHRPELAVWFLFATIDWLFHALPDQLKDEAATWLALVFIFVMFSLATPGKTGVSMRRTVFRGLRMMTRLLGRGLKYSLRAFGLMKFIVDGDQHQSRRP